MMILLEMHMAVVQGFCLTAAVVHSKWICLESENYDEKLILPST